MKALTITEPWATLIAIGAKRIETRSWPTDYRGPIAIHASKKITSAEVELAIAQDEPIAEALALHGVQIFWTAGAIGHTYQAFSDTRGCVIATGRLTDCIPFTQESVRKICAVYGAHELDFGDFTAGRYGFVISDITPVQQPIPARGSLGLWEWTPPPSCRDCGCTDLNCSGCVERTGERCHWVEPDLCSACAGEPTK